MTPTQVNQALLVIIPLLCLGSTFAGLFIWALCKTGATQDVPDGNEDYLG